MQDDVEMKEGELSAQAENAQAVVNSPDVMEDEDTDDEAQFQEMKAKKKQEAKTQAKYVDRLARLKIDRYRLVGEDKLLVKYCPYRTAKKKEMIAVWPTVVPESMIPTILSLFHGDKSMLLHAGKHKTYGIMRNRFVWKGMVQSIRQWISACHKCLLRKRQVPQQTKYNVQPQVNAPMKRICIDLVGPFVETANGNTHILTIYDPFSHWPAAYPISRTDSKTIIQCLKRHIAIHSVPTDVLSDRGANLMSAEVKQFLDTLGAKKYETTAYKPSSNGSVERFHRYLGSAIAQCVDDMEGKGDKQNQWDEHIDAVLLTYRTMPIDGLDISPFEVMFGRNPNLPIDNILFRENYNNPAQTLQEYLDMMYESQLNMYEAIEQTRKDRFERNKRNSPQKPPMKFKVGDKVYLSYPPGRWRPLHGSTKLSRVNDGPFTVMEELYNGLVYNVKHDRKKTEEKVSVTRMIPVPQVILPDNVTDLPNDNLKQFGPREDRINDVTRQEHEQRQQELGVEANIEAKAADNAEVKEGEIKTKSVRFEDEEKEKTQASKHKPGSGKKKQPSTVPDQQGNPDLKGEEREMEFQMEAETDSPEVKEIKLKAKEKKVRAAQIAQQTYSPSDLRKKHITKADQRGQRAQRREDAKQEQESMRTKLTKARAQIAGEPPEELRTLFMWMSIAPRRRTMLSNSLERVWGVNQHEQNMGNRVTPTVGGETEVRLGAHEDEDEDEMIMVDPMDQYYGGIWVHDIRSRDSNRWSRLGDRKAPVTLSSRLRSSNNRISSKRRFPL